MQQKRDDTLCILVLFQLSLLQLLIPSQPLLLPGATLFKPLHAKRLGHLVLQELHDLPDPKLQNARNSPASSPNESTLYNILYTFIDFYSMLETVLAPMSPVFVSHHSKRELRLRFRRCISSFCRSASSACSAAARIGASCSSSRWIRSLRRCRSSVRAAS